MTISEQNLVWSALARRSKGQAVPGSDKTCFFYRHAALRIAIAGRMDRRKPH